MKFNYDLLLNEIDKHYKASKLEYKIMMFCKDIKIKIYRFRKILNNQAYFQNDEIFKINRCLDLKIDNPYFLNVS